MEVLQESSWLRGLTPNIDNLTELEGGLLSMKNLDIDEKGSLRAARGHTNFSNSAVIGADVLSIFSTKLTTDLVLRNMCYYYANDGILHRNYGGSQSLNIFDLNVFTGATSKRCAFLAALGHVFAIAGNKKYKDNGTTQGVLGLAAPSLAPSTSINPQVFKALDNKSGGLYTNWSAPESSYFLNTGTSVDFTPSTTTLRGIIETVFASTLDATDLGGTGKDTPEDVFTLYMWVDEPNSLKYTKIEFICEDPTTGIQNYYWQAWDQDRDVAPFSKINISPTTWTPITLRRSDFIRVGNDGSKGWQNIKAVRITCDNREGVVNTGIRFKDIIVAGGTPGNLEGLFEYLEVQVNDTGSYIEISKQSPIISVMTYVCSVEITPQGVADPQANRWWYYRRSAKTGDFVLIKKMTTREPFVDNLSDEDALANAAIDVTSQLLYTRENLPNDIIDMIWLSDRVIYLTPQGFIPSNKLDPSTYDSRYSYEIGATTSERCLFIVKIDMGSFLVATNKDFYKVTGTFAEINNGNVLYQDVNIMSLGISDPPVCKAYAEWGGGLLYFSATGLRLLNNTTSILMNGPLDPLFRGETCYGISAINLATYIDSEDIKAAIITKGKQIIISVPINTTTNNVFVLTMEGEGSYWRHVTNNDPAYNPITFHRMEDGTILYGARAGASNYIKVFEQAFGSGSIGDFHMLTKYNFDGTKNVRKDPLMIEFEAAPTVDQTMNFKIYGIKRTWEIDVWQSSFITSLGLDIFRFDLQQYMTDAYLGFAIEMWGSFNNVQIKRISISYNPHPPLVRRIVLPATNFNKPGRKRITALPFILDSFDSNVTVTVTNDDSALTPQTVNTRNPTTVAWLGDGSNVGTDWGAVLTCANPFEFYGWLEPVITELFPFRTKEVKLPTTNFGKLNRKRIGAFPFKLDTLGQAATVRVFKDEIALVPDLSINTSGIDTLAYRLDEIGIDWAIEITCPTVFEFYEFLPPIVIEEFPPLLYRAVLPTTNLGKDNRKLITRWPFVVNPFNNAITVKMWADRVAQQDQSVNASDIATLAWGGNVTALDYRLELHSSNLFEFYNWMTPEIIRLYPTPTRYKIFPMSNFCNGNKKKMSGWPFMVDPRGGTINVIVSTEAGVISNSMNITGNSPKTFIWQNTSDVAYVDWQMELVSSTEFEFYEFKQPEWLQIFPLEKKYDQLGPLDFNCKGLVFGFRLRVQNEGNTIHYQVYEQDTLVFEEDITTVPNKDEVYNRKFPKGIDPSVCRVVLSSTTEFHRFSGEFQVRLLGKETEHKYVKVKDSHAIN